MSKECILTVNGPIDGSELGFCHSHDHLFIAKGKSWEVDHNLCLDDFNKTVDELNVFKKAGGKCIIDAQPIGCGRMEKNLCEASCATGINIVASTGFHKLDFYDTNHWIHEIDETQLVDIFTAEITKGMFIDGNTCFPEESISSRVGVIKVASGAQGIDEKYLKLFNAAAEASIRTSAPLLVHMEMGKWALDQVQFFCQKGIAPQSIIMCHLDRRLNDISYILDVARTGVFIELDTIGRFKYHTDEIEAELILKLVERGFEDRILLGLDSTMARLKSYGGSIGLDYIIKSFIPLLRQYGLKDNIIDKFIIQNPAKAFAFKLIDGDEL